jgi:hypothetical protein
MPSTTLLEIPPEEQAQMRAILRRARYGYLRPFHILLGIFAHPPSCPA